MNSHVSDTVHDAKPQLTGLIILPAQDNDRVHLRHRPAPHEDHRGPGSRAAGLAMAFKLIEAAQDRWRAVNGPHLVALVRAGATFVNGKLVERPDETPQPEAA